MVKVQAKMESASIFGTLKVLSAKYIQCKHMHTILTTFLQVNLG